MKVTSLRKNFYSRKWIDDFKIQVTPEDLGMGFIVSFIIDWGNERLTMRGEFKRKHLINGLKSLLNMYHYT